MTIADKGTKKHIIMQLIRFHNTATALNISIFIFNHIFDIRIYFINGITGDADTLRGSPQVRGRSGVLSSSAGSLIQTEWICSVCGDVKREAGAHCALSACGVPVSPWAKWGCS